MCRNSLGFFKQLVAILRGDETPGDQLGNVIGNAFIRRCERKNGKLVNTTIKTYKDVGQFWTFDEKWFLAQPVYSRDYPPLKG